MLIFVHNAYMRGQVYFGRTFASVKGIPYDGQGIILRSRLGFSSSQGKKF